MSTEDIMRVIEADPYANVTFSGGDPMYQAAGFAELAREIHRRTNKDIWCFTGFRFENLIQEDQRELLEQIDVLVDGPYVESLRDEDLLFRGSSNQRLIDVQASLYAGEVLKNLFSFCVLLTYSYLCTLKFNVLDEKTVYRDIRMSNECC
jgi:anaerobic ribonucleoside-triphosphate reductase activating protein